MLEVPTTDADWLFVIGLIFKFSKIIIIIIINYNKSNNNSNNNDNNSRLTAWEHVRLIVKRQSRMRWGEGEQQEKKETQLQRENANRNKLLHGRDFVATDEVTGEKPRERVKQTCLKKETGEWLWPHKNKHWEQETWKCEKID